MAPINHPANLLDRIIRMERQISEVRKKVGLSSATISRGGLTVLEGGFIRIIDPTDTEVFLADGSGNVKILGQLRTADSGARIVVNPEVDANFDPQAIHFYPTSNEAAYSRIQGFDLPNGFSGLRLTAGRDTSVSWQTGYCDLTDDQARIYWGNPAISDPDTGTITVPEDIHSEVVIHEETLSAVANWPTMISDPSVGPNNFQGIVFRHRDATGTSLYDSDLDISNADSAGLGSRPSIRSVAGNVRLMWDDVNGELQVLAYNPGAGFKAIRASAFLVASSRRSKQNVRELPTRARDIIRNAPATEWEYTPAPQGTARRPIDKPQPGGPRFEEIELPAQAPQRHVGPMAEDLPEHLVIRNLADPDDLAVDVRDLAGVLWAEAHDAIAERDELRAQVAALTERVAALEARGRP